MAKKIQTNICLNTENKVLKNLFCMAEARVLYGGSSCAVCHGREACFCMAEVRFYMAEAHRGRGFPTLHRVTHQWHDVKVHRVPFDCTLANSFKKWKISPIEGKKVNYLFYFISGFQTLSPLILFVVWFRFRS